MKAKRTGMLSELLIPQPNNVNPTAHMKVKDEKSIETILLRRNAGHITIQYGTFGKNFGSKWTMQSIYLTN